MRQEISRWWVEILAGEGRCKAHLMYQHGSKPSVIWATTDWTLPAVALRQDLILQELIDVSLVLMERSA